MKNFLAKSLFLTIEFVNQILIFVAIVWWLQIATKNGNLLMVNHDGENDSDKFSANIYQLEVLASLTYNYIVISTFIIFLLIIRILPFLLFSRKLCKFFDTLDDAKYSIWFFEFLVCVFILAYSFAGYLLFGYKISSFSFIGKSFIGCLQIISGSITDADLQEIHANIGPVYYFSFQVKKIN